MNITSSYDTQIIGSVDFKDTTKIYREALSFVVDVVNKEWDFIRQIKLSHAKQIAVEKLIHSTKDRNAKYLFDLRFPKFPSYLRRAVCSKAIGIVSSYRSNLKNWKENPVGKEPRLQLEHNAYPAFYDKNMYLKTEDPTVIQLKLYQRNDWIWVDVKLRGTDVKYLRKYWMHLKPCAPVLEKRYGKYYLRFAFEESIELIEAPVEERRICAVDLGINSDAVCSIMKADGTTIAMMLMSDVDLKSYSNTAYHNEELKSLTRYRFDKVKERAKLKSSVAQLVNILFPELEKLVSSLHIAVVYALLSNYPGASYIANANTEELAETLCTASKGRYTKSKTAEIQVAAGVSIGSKMPAKSMELKHTIALIRELDKEISEVESAIDKITSQMDSPIFTIPGIGRHMGAMILAEVGDFSNFASADKLLAYAGLSPSTYQSGQLQNCYAHMEKRGSRYLRYALFNAAKYVCLWCPTFSAYLEKKRSEGKHYNVAISHAAKKLVRLIFAMQRSGKAFLADY